MADRGAKKRLGLIERRQVSVKGALLSVLARDNAKDCMEDGWNFRGL